MNNRRFARTVGWLVLAGAVAAGVLAWYVTRQPASPFEQEQATASFDPALVSRGEYVARVSDCVACHSLAGKAPFAGGLEMATPLGRFMPPTSRPTSMQASVPTPWPTSTARCATALRRVGDGSTRPCRIPLM